MRCDHQAIGDESNKKRIYPSAKIPLLSHCSFSHITSETKISSQVSHRLLILNPFPHGSLWIILNSCNSYLFNGFKCLCFPARNDIILVEDSDVSTFLLSALPVLLILLRLWFWMVELYRLPDLLFVIQSFFDCVRVQIRMFPGVLPAHHLKLKR